MDIIRKINQSRYVLKKHLEKEWDVSVIQDISDKEVEIMYNTKSPKNAMLIEEATDVTRFHQEISTNNLEHYLPTVNV